MNNRALLSIKDATRIQFNFFKKIGFNDHGENLFNFIPAILFFVKDKKGKFIKVNQAFLERFGFQDEAEVIGQTDFDMIPAYLARKYTKDDRHVMTSGKPILNKVELVTGCNQTVDWYITCKLPLKDKTNTVAGIAGMTQFFRKADITFQPYLEISGVVEYIHNNYNGSLKMHDLCKLAGLSLSAFERKFKIIFHMPPLRYIKMVRIQEACQAMIKSNKSIAQIASETGFADQSHLTREFIKVMGTSPKHYRKSHLSVSSNNA